MFDLFKSSKRCVFPIQFVGSMIVGFLLVGEDRYRVVWNSRLKYYFFLCSYTMFTNLYFAQFMSY